MIGDSIVARLGVCDVLIVANIPTPSRANKLVNCPLPGHVDATPSFRVFNRGWICFGCNRKGGVLDLVVALGYAHDRREAAKWLEGRCT